MITLEPAEHAVTAVAETSSRAWRLFIALPLPEAPRATLERQLGPYRHRHATARWLAPRSWHLTLLFLGEVRSARVAEVVALVDAIAAAAAPFGAAIEAGGGRVGRDGDGVAWLRLGFGAGQLIALADRLASACPVDMSLHGAPKRTLSAHLTVARRADRALVESLGVERHGPLRADWTTDRMALLRSHLGSAGSDYETLHEATLYAPRPVGQAPTTDEEGS